MKKLINQKGYILLIIGIIIAVIAFIKIEDINLIQPSWFVPNLKASNMMNNISSKDVKGKKTDSKFITNTTDFSIELFKNSLSEEGNSMISPVSAMLPLAMAANGADGNTLIQMTKVLGKDIPLESLNEYLYTFRKKLNSSWKSKLNISNSIWFRDSLNVDKGFLQTNADYYNSSIYKSAFDNQTLKDINNWVKKNTNGHIDKIVDGLDNDNMMFLINTLEFDAKWQEKYKKTDINDDKFYNLNGSVTNCKFMNSAENYYLDDGKAIGFIKPYYNDHYRFVALLPNDGVTSYIKQMTGEKFIDTLTNATETSVSATIPEFHYEYMINMNDALSTLGMPDAFSRTEANFSKMVNPFEDMLYIAQVLQKTYIYVDNHGTKAGAVTSIRLDAKSSPYYDKSVILDRPFVYAIVNSKTNIPIFLGVVTDMGSIHE